MKNNVCISIDYNNNVYSTKRINDNVEVLGVGEIDELKERVNNLDDNYGRKLNWYENGDGNWIGEVIMYKEDEDDVDILYMIIVDV